MRRRATLVARVARYAARYPREIPRPPHWAGYRVVPGVFEFWREGAFRLHDRIRYTRVADGWQSEMLYP